MSRQKDEDMKTFGSLNTVGLYRNKWIVDRPSFKKASELSGKRILSDDLKIISSLWVHLSTSALRVKVQYCSTPEYCTNSHAAIGRGEWRIKSPFHLSRVENKKQEATFS